MNLFPSIEFQSTSSEDSGAEFIHYPDSSVESRDESISLEVNPFLMY